MASVEGIRNRLRGRWIEALCSRSEPLLAGRTGAEMWLDSCGEACGCGSWACGDWDTRSNGDLLVVAPQQSSADQLAEELLGAGLGDDVIAISRDRWLERRRVDHLWWRGICRDAIRLQPPPKPARGDSTPRPATTASRLPKGPQSAVAGPRSGAGENHSSERLLGALESLGIETAPLQQQALEPLQRMTTASRVPDDDAAPVDLFDERDGALALEVARAVMDFADEQLRGLVQTEPPDPHQAGGAGV